MASKGIRGLAQVLQSAARAEIEQRVEEARTRVGLMRALLGMPEEDRSRLADKLTLAAGSLAKHDWAGRRGDWDRAAKHRAEFRTRSADFAGDLIRTVYGHPWEGGR